MFEQVFSPGSDPKGGQGEDETPCLFLPLIHETWEPGSAQPHAQGTGERRRTFESACPEVGYDFICFPSWSIARIGSSTYS
jgi:hypothetical protein